MARSARWLMCTVLVRVRAGSLTSDDVPLKLMTSKSAPAETMCFIGNILHFFRHFREWFGVCG